MAKPVNKRRGEVDFSGAGEGVYLRFTNDAMERLYSDLGDRPDYIEETIRRVGNFAPPAFFKTVLGVMLVGKADPNDWPWEYTRGDVKMKILDAIYLSVMDKTFTEFQEEQTKLHSEELEKLKQDPRQAAQLILQILSTLSTDTAALPVSDQTKSDSTPSTKSSDSPDT